MVDMASWSVTATQFLNRVHSRLAARAGSATAFVSQPEPRATGQFARGRQLCAGNLMFAGYLAEAPGTSIWDIEVDDSAWQEEIHAFGWLDDLAAVGDAQARELAQNWLMGWIDRYGRGTGPGWVPELSGRRLIRWIHHALFLLRGMTPEQSTRFYRALAAQTRFLAKRRGAALPGLPRFEALTGLIYASLSLEGMGAYLDPARRALDLECTRQIDVAGGLPTRNPEELLEVFTLLTWARAALEEGDIEPGPAHLNAITRIAPSLRALRHADGGLARFHGGGRGAEGRLDQALAASGVRRRPVEGLAMGFARLAGGRSTVIIDAAAPPAGRASAEAHAATLGFELTSGRRPLIVSCGAGKVFGEEWRRAGRATPSHSTLCLDASSSSKLGARRRIGGIERELIVEAPADVPVELEQDASGWRFEGAHDGWKRSHGLTHARKLELTLDGRMLSGEDMLFALDAGDRKAFDRRIDKAGLSGIPYEIRFHLHPDVDAEIDMGGTAVSLALRSGEIWVFRTEPGADLSLESSVYLEKGRLRPRGAQQIVLSGRAIEYATRIRWSLGKAQDTAVAIRDLAQDEPDVTL
ncbi:heparinase [Salipiger sp. CCB-MM3]|uniref:heparinase II/III family protein n=1 Tax=Salipiger sp. CCB-MM3 TaxID=1792508 RepID=UPI00080AAB9E|nr:heparinase II/III family protein [Salipiger sp. CCB-MM3]ANT62050.1 heparinase [Salipiger sp. CCB-MM3]